MLAGCMAGNIAAAFAYASDVSAPEKRTAALGLIGAAIGIGFSLGPPLGGLLAGADPHTANFMRPALVSACLSVLAILLVRFVLPESHGAATPAGASGRVPARARGSCCASARRSRCSRPLRSP